MSLSGTRTSFTSTSFNNSSNDIESSAASEDLTSAHEASDNEEDKLSESSSQIKSEENHPNTCNLPAEPEESLPETGPTSNTISHNGDQNGDTTTQVNNPLELDGHSGEDSLPQIKTPSQMEDTQQSIDPSDGGEVKKDSSIRVEVPRIEEPTENDEDSNPVPVHPTDYLDQKQEKEKADKQAKNDALQEICRESLDNDRREAKERQVAKRREKQSRKVGSTSFPASLLPELPSFQPLEANKDDPEADPPGTHHSLASGPLDLPESVPGRHEPEGFGALKEEDEASYFDIEDEELPWHHLQLYRMYGQQADYFLHPKIETEQKDPIPLNPKLRQIGGRAGAATLWTILRNESRMRLLKQDSKLLSPDLRSAFGAFAREGLAKKRQPVKRNYSSDDVPDMARLMDQSRVHHAQDFRHKVELMFRSSQINQDRTKVLLYNNPPPDMNNQEGLESVERYMPSWMDDQWDKESELSYKKWLQSKAHEDQDTQSALQSARSSRSKRTPLTRTTSQNHPKLTPTPEDWNFILRKSPTKPRLKPDQPKIFFLTEEDATVKGEFSKRRKEIEEAHHLPKSIQTDLPQKSFSAMAMLGGGDRENSLVQSHSLTSIGTSKRSPRSKSEMTQNFNSPWQPLSLGALIEYKDNRKALGQGTFNQGKTAVWPTGRASAAV